MSLRRWCPRYLGENYYQAIARGSLEETWSLCACILPSPRRCPIFCEILDPPQNCQARRRGIHQWVRIGFSGDGLGRGIFNPSVVSFTSDQAHQARTDFKSYGRNSLGPCGVLVWPCWLAGEDMPIPLLPLGSAGKALLTPVRKEVEWQYKCFIEWKYQKYIGYQELCRQNEKEK